MLVRLVISILCGAGAYSGWVHFHDWQVVTSCNLLTCCYLLLRPQYFSYVDLFSPWVSYNMIALFPQNEWSKRQQGGSGSVFYDLLSDVIHCHFCHIPFFRKSQSLNLVHIQREENWPSLFKGKSMWPYFKSATPGEMRSFLHGHTRSWWSIWTTI